MRCLPVRLALAAALHTLPVGGSCPAVAAEVAPVDAWPTDTNQIQRLTLEQARKLAAEFPGVTVPGKFPSMSSRWIGCLPLNGLKSLDVATAQALAEFKGRGDLQLNGLTTLDAATARALADSKAWNGRLPKLTVLDADTARAVAPLDKWNGNLSSIVALESPDSVEIAAALATKKGPLSLRNLKKISPKTLAALIEKEDVEIPPIETLELIPEPDGSPTEDFVIPEGFYRGRRLGSRADRTPPLARRSSRSL